MCNGNIDENSNQQLQLLVIMAHPADTFDHCGGTLLHHIRQGDKVTVVSMYQGVHVHDEVISDKLRMSGTTIHGKESDELRNTRESIKNAEVIDACKILGITDVIFMGIEDKINLTNEDTIIELAKIIREVKPDLLITHYPLITLGMGPHCQAGEAVLRASTFAGNLDFNNPGPGHRTPQILFTMPDNYLRKHNVISAESSCYCDLFIDVSDVIKEITLARDCLKSQQYGGDYAKKSVETTFGCLGNSFGCAYAECFIRYNPEVRYTLPLPKEMKERANESEKDNLERISIMSVPDINLG